MARKRGQKKNNDVDDGNSLEQVEQMSDFDEQQLQQFQLFQQFQKLQQQQQQQQQPQHRPQQQQQKQKQPQKQQYQQQQNSYINESENHQSNRPDVPRVDPNDMHKDLIYGLDFEFDPFKTILLTTFLLSTPVAMFAVFSMKQNITWWAFANSYGFAGSMALLYLYPFIDPFTATGNRLNVATWNWIVYLSTFTEILFQIPHNLAVPFLFKNKGSVFEWPFASYGLVDSRWCEYNNGDGLAPEVSIINYNDGFLGLLVLFMIILHYRCPSNFRMKLAFILVLVFRDVTLWRETVEYMYQHHFNDYPYTTTDPEYRTHGIIVLWLVNGIWILAPCLTVIWAYYEIIDMANRKILGVMANIEKKEKTA